LKKKKSKKKRKVKRMMGELITVDFPLPYPIRAVMPVLDLAVIYECILVYIYRLLGATMAIPDHRFI